jgi:hypothetical protein
MSKFGCVTQPVERFKKWSKITMNSKKNHLGCSGVLESIIQLNFVSSESVTQKGASQSFCCTKSIPEKIPLEI